MDKKMFIGYVRQLVREAVEEELDRVLSKKLTEVINSQTHVVSENSKTPPNAAVRPKPSRTELARMLGLERLDSETLVASTNNLVTSVPPTVDPSNENVQKTMSIINRDYSAIMKKLT
jgi:hypothetical protein